MGSAVYKEKPFKVQEHVVLHSNSKAYLVEEFVGEGSFGKVAKCTDLCTNEDVAIKFLRIGHYKAGKREGKILNRLKQLDPEKNNLTKFYERFKYKGHACLVFEMLDISLFDYMEKRDMLPLHVSEIRTITQQLLVALKALNSIGLSHADIKSDNVLLVNHQSQPFKVKLADFGLTTRSNALWRYGTFQNPSHRAPEIFLGLPLNEAVDMWSLGCTIAFLYLGKNLFPLDSNYQVMKAIVKIIGIPSYLLDEGHKTETYFHQMQWASNPLWKWKKINEYSGDVGRVYDPSHVYRKIRSLDDLPRRHMTPNMPADPEDTEGFISLLKEMLRVDPEKRITPAEALDHPFITQTPLLSRASRTSSLTLTLRKMREIRLNAGRTPARLRNRFNTFINNVTSTDRESDATSIKFSARNKQVRDSYDESEEVISAFAKFFQGDTKRHVKPKEALNHTFISKKPSSKANGKASEALSQRNITDIRLSAGRTPAILRNNSTFKSDVINADRVAAATYVEVSGRNKQVKDECEDTEASEELSHHFRTQKDFSETNSKPSETLTQKSVTEIQLSEREDKKVTFSAATTPNPAKLSDKSTSSTADGTNTNKVNAVTYVKVAVGNKQGKDGKYSEQMSGHFPVIECQEEGSSVIATNSRVVITNNGMTIINVYYPHAAHKETDNAADVQQTAPARRKHTTTDCSGGTSPADKKSKPAAKTAEKATAADTSTTSSEMSNTASASPAREEQSYFVEIKSRNKFIKRIGKFFSQLVMCVRGTD